MINKKWFRGWCASVVLVCGCSSTIAIPNFPEETTLSPLAEPRCNSEEECVCRDVGAENAQEQGISPGHSRFEFIIPRTKSGIWVEVGDRGVYYKPKGVLGRDCFYLDLPQGVHQVRVVSARNHDHEGLVTGLEVNRYGELGEKSEPFWYPVFVFDCNGRNSCTNEGASYWLQKQQALPGGQLNRCSETHVGKVQYTGDESSTTTGLEKFVLVFDLHINDLTPTREPGDAACR